MISVTWGEVGIQTLEDEDGGTLKVEFDDEFRCPRCGNVFADEDSARVDSCDMVGDTGSDAHELVRAPLAWANHATIELDPEDDAITVGISVTEERGAFTLKMRRLEDGTLIMHVPHEGMNWQHAPMVALYPGSFAVNAVRQDSE